MNRPLCSPISLHGVSFVRASEGSSKKAVFEASKNKHGNGCFLGEPTRRRPVLPRPALPRRPAVRRPARPTPAVPPVLCQGFGFKK